MRVIHITDVHPRHDARILQRQAVSLAEAGHDVILVTCDGKPNETYKGVHITSYTDHTMSKRERFFLLFFNKQFIKYLLSFNADIYQIHDFELIEVGRKLKKLGKHVIFDSHENWIDIIPDYITRQKRLRELVRSVFLCYYRRTVKSFDAVFSVSPNMVNVLKEYNPKSYLVPNYPSINGYQIRKRDSRGDYFIYQGVVYSISNQGSIVQALSMMDHNVRYVVVGKMSDKVKQDILSKDVMHRVDIRGWVEKDELDEIMRGSICGLVILDYVPTCCGKQGQLGSNKIFEYMLCGLPVICTNFTLWRELIIEKYQNGICVEPGDVVQIKEALEWMVNNPDEAIKMGERGRKAVINEFNWEKGLPQYLSRYSEILNCEA